MELTANELCPEVAFPHLILLGPHCFSRQVEAMTSLTVTLAGLSPLSSENGLLLGLLLPCDLAFFSPIFLWSRVQAGTGLPVQGGRFLWVGGDLP